MAYAINEVSPRSFCAVGSGICMKRLPIHPALGVSSSSLYFLSLLS